MTPERDHYFTLLEECSKNLDDVTIENRALQTTLDQLKNNCLELKVVCQSQNVSQSRDQIMATKANPFMHTEGLMHHVILRYARQKNRPSALFLFVFCAMLQCNVYVCYCYCTVCLHTLLGNHCFHICAASHRRKVTLYGSCVNEG